MSDIIKDITDDVNMDTEGVVEEVLYKCGYCDIPDRFDSIAFVKKHHENCIQNIENKSCATCKHLMITKLAPNEEDIKKDIQLKVWMSTYIKGHCGKKDKILYEKDFFKKYKCWEMYDESDPTPKRRYTDEYKRYLENNAKYMNVDDVIREGSD